MSIVRLYGRFFGAVERIGEAGFIGLFARFTFLAVLFLYYFNSWKTKAGEGVSGILSVNENSWYQIVPWAVERAGGDVTQVGLLDDLIVYAGTYAELLLPLMIVAGLFARAAALGMIGFVAVQSFVDIRFHGVGPETTGALFDRFPDSVILDQRLLWVFLLSMIVFKGAGALSLDWLLTRFRQPAARPATLAA
ncbi:MAG: DoxX family protein [Nitratireductor sp.]|nr:DoxX family protein [Nitratireductor sp.]